MMRALRLRQTIALACVALMTLVGQASAQQQAGGQQGARRGARMGPAMYVEQSWAALCFEVNISADQIAKLRPTYQWAWKVRNAVLKTAMEKQDFQSAAPTLEKVKSTIDERVKMVLTSKQLAQWSKWQKAQANRRRSSRGAQK